MPFQRLSTGVTGKGGIWRTKPQDAESAVGTDSPEVRAKPRTCLVHAVFGIIVACTLLR